MHTESSPTLRLRACPRAAPSAALEARLHDILDRPLDPFAPPATTFDRKERELATAFAALSLDDAHAIYVRLVINHADDSLAIKFTRLSERRRARLLAFLFTLCEVQP